jgi:hypothetical protein
LAFGGAELNSPRAGIVVSVWAARATHFLMEEPAMKIVPGLLGLACSLLLASPAGAETWSRRLTREKPDENFTIKVDRLKEPDGGEVFQFRVTVKLKDSEGLPVRARVLRVFNGTEFVSSCEVQPTGPDGARVFSFRVAAKYLEKSTFSYTESGEEGSSIGYWFYLKDFAEPK